MVCLFYGWNIGRVSTGCILLSVGQDEFHREAVDTLNYVVKQSDYTVQTLVNITGYLSLAKTVNVAQVFLPSDVKDNIDKLNVDLNNAAGTLRHKTHLNSPKLRFVFDTVRSSRIAIAIVMLLVSGGVSDGCNGVGGLRCWRDRDLGLNCIDGCEGADDAGG
ncbi:putative transmembrane protein [Helianthus annuus]|nr:putative transmembrane protein [Helianthus annuus]